MNFGIALLALVSLALATDKGGQGDYGDKGKGHDSYETVTTEVEVTVTTPCPTTETVVEAGKTYTKTYTKYLTTVVTVPTTVYTTVKGPDVTETEKEVVYTTVTKEEPCTETKYIGGKTVVVTYTKTEVIKTKVPVTEYVTVEGHDVTTTAEAKEYVTVTETKPVVITKTEGGKTKCVTITKTKTKTVGAEHTVTVPGAETTETTKVYETVVVTLPGGTVTVPGKTVWETIHKTVTETVQGPPATVVQPPATSKTEVTTTETTTVAPPAPPPAVSESASESVPAPSTLPSAAAQANRAPVMAMVIGVAGAIAML